MKTKEYVIIYTYFNQYAEGICGSDRTQIIYRGEKPWTSKEAYAYKKAQNWVNEAHKGRPTDYGQVGAMSRTYVVLELKAGQDPRELGMSWYYPTVTIVK